ncbi:MAG: hypothetical protein AB8G22_23015 [Saprospiraceae bacterium]
MQRRHRFPKGEVLPQLSNKESRLPQRIGREGNTDRLVGALDGAGTGVFVVEKHFFNDD